MQEGSKSCPICGSNSVSSSERDELYQLTLGEKFRIKETVLKCSNCQYEFSDIEANEKKLNEALPEERKKLSEYLVAKVQEKCASMAFIERAFELPIRTMNRWKSGGESSATSLAFLRLLHTYPWLVDVADKKFEPSAAHLILWREAMSSMSSVAEQMNGMFAGHAEQNPDELRIMASFIVKGDNCNDENENNAYQLTG